MATNTTEPRLHCTYCGRPFDAGRQGWPRVCGGCGRTTFRNPLPVVVVLLPVLDRGGGLLAVRRTIDPGRGKFALPGGYIDWNDPAWQHAAARELREETGLDLPPDTMRAFRVVSAPDKTLLLFTLAEGVRSADLPPFAATNETDGLAVLTGPGELAFPIHAEVVAEYFGAKSEILHSKSETNLKCKGGKDY